jgi:excinuclease UvrABC nuclease subunit
MTITNPTIQDFRDTIENLNARFPRPGITLTTSERYDVYKDYARTFPNSDSPGVYALIHENESEVLRIGKARCLGYRLGAYFRWADKEAGKGMEKHPDYSKARYIVTVPVAADRAFEAHSVEGFLLGRLKPALNKMFESFENDSN